METRLGKGKRRSGYSGLTALGELSGHGFKTVEVQRLTPVVENRGDGYGIREMALPALSYISLYKMVPTPDCMALS
jgi:hypothetical protein